ncbi:hypothetical protein [Streptomyces herbicida]|uniref:hypothetical protein n=1 Tax=Streptomyces herbicida TaxID=3065675 RepID=UPI00292FCE4D|nr:hypothetical protein [Streptomyces sp. NEAU-HV9]
MQLVQTRVLVAQVGGQEGRRSVGGGGQDRGGNAQGQRQAVTQGGDGLGRPGVVDDAGIRVASRGAQRSVH